MTQRCMTSAFATGALGDWLANLPSHLPGNRSGNPSILSVVLPPSDVIDTLDPDRIIHLPEEYVTDDKGEPDLPASIHRWLSIVGPQLTQGGNFVLFGPSWIWRILHNTPYWNLWCGLYESDTDPQFTADKSAAGLPPEFTINQSRQAMFQHFSGAIS